jgi:hypothetical protein
MTKNSKNDDEEYSEESEAESEEEEEENWSDEESPVKKKAKSVKTVASSDFAFLVATADDRKMPASVTALPKVDLIDLTTGNDEDGGDDNKRPARVSALPTSLVAQKQSKAKAMSRPCKSAFIRFFESKRNETEAANPDTKFGDILKIIQNNFNELSKEEQSAWAEAEKADEIKSDQSDGELVWRSAWNSTHSFILPTHILPMISFFISRMHCQ